MSVNTYHVRYDDEKRLDTLLQSAMIQHIQHKINESEQTHNLFW